MTDTTMLFILALTVLVLVTTASAGAAVAMMFRAHRAERLLREARAMLTERAS